MMRAVILAIRRHVHGQGPRWLLGAAIVSALLCVFFVFRIDATERDAADVHWALRRLPPDNGRREFAVALLGIAVSALGVWWFVRQCNRRQPRSAKFWITLSVAVLVGYPASFGPFCWIDSRIRRFRGNPLDRVYAPLLWAADESPWLKSKLEGYANFGAGRGHPVLLSDRRINWWGWAIDDSIKWSTPNLTPISPESLTPIPPEWESKPENSWGEPKADAEENETGEKAEYESNSRNLLTSREILD